MEGQGGGEAQGVVDPPPKKKATLHITWHRVVGGDHLEESEAGVDVRHGVVQPPRMASAERERTYVSGSWVRSRQGIRYWQCCCTYIHVTVVTC
jgi:hypothetical protein